MNKDIKNLHKRNLILIAADHKRHCKSSKCEIHLLSLLRVATMAGLTFTEEEREAFY